MLSARSRSYLLFTIGAESCGVSGYRVMRVDQAENIETFTWRDLRFHVVTPEPLTSDQYRVLARSVPKIARVGQFAELVAMVLGRHVRIRTERPSPDVRFEVGRLGVAAEGSAQRPA